MILDIGGNRRCAAAPGADAAGHVVIVGGERRPLARRPDRALRALLLGRSSAQRLTMLVAKEHHAGLDRLAAAG